MAQLRMFAEEGRPPIAPTADLGRVRRRLESFLTEARSAGTDKLPEQRRRFLRTVVPQMAKWLPPEEAELTLKTFAEVIPS